MWNSLVSDLTILDVVEDTEDAQEEVDEVKVQANSTNNELIRGQSFVDHIRIKHNISTEDQSTKTAVNEVNGLWEWEEDANEAGDDQSDETREEEGGHPGEVILGLEGKQGQAAEDGEGD